MANLKTCEGEVYQPKGEWGKPKNWRTIEKNKRFMLLKKRES